MCWLEDVYYSGCGCWRSSPRVASYCAVGKSTPYYRAYGCKHSKVSNSATVDSLCTNCGSSTWSSAASSRRESTISSASSGSHVFPSARLRISCDSTLGPDAGNLGSNGYTKAICSVDDENDVNGKALQNGSSGRKRNISVVPPLDLAALDQVLARQSQAHTSSIGNNTGGRIIFNEHIFSTSHMPAGGSSIDGPVGPLPGPLNLAVSRSSVHDGESDRVMDFALHMLSKIRQNCGGGRVGELRERRASERHMGMHTMRER